MTPRTPAFAELLRRHRRAAGLTQGELAEHARISVRALSDLERGVRRAPHIGTLRLLADALRLGEDERTALLESARQARRAEASHPSARPFSPVGDFPVTLTPLIGREREQAALAHLVLRDDVRLLTLTGPAGIGKTHLATRVALDPSAGVPGAVFVPLAAIGEHALVLPTIAHALGLRDQANRAACDRLCEYLSGREVLLVLDNFEQVVHAGPAVAHLLAACPRVKALVTSRVALRVRGEHEFSVPPLDTPDPAQLPAPDELTRYAAVSLFVERARAVEPDFAVTPALAPVVAAICARLDGIPLALELAAARIKVLPPQALLARLDKSLAVLTTGAADLPERQRTMRRAIEWSYDLLDESQQRLFRRLAVFVDGWTLEAAQAVCGRDEAPFATVLDGLAGLVASSLVVRAGDSGGEPRFRLLQLMREYGWERLVAHGEASLLRSRHADYYRALAETAAPQIHGPDQRPWLVRLAQEHPNLRAALDWARETHSIECGLRLGSALHSFWQLHGLASEGRAWLEHFLSLSLQSLQRPGEAVGDNALRADALRGAGHLAWVQGDYEAAAPLLAESLDLYRAQAHPPGIAHVLNIQGMIADERGEHARAVALYDESLALWRGLGDVTQIGRLLNNLAVGEFLQERYTDAKSLFEESLALQRTANNHRSIAITLCNLGEIMRMEGDLTTAAVMIGEGLDLYRELGDRGEMAYGLVNLADVVRERGDLERAALLNHEALAIAGEVGATFAVVRALESMAEIACLRGHSALATQVFALATILRETHHLPRTGRHAKTCAARIDELHATSGKEPFAAAWDRGKHLSLDEAIQLLGTPQTVTASRRPNATAPGRNGRESRRKNGHSRAAGLPA
jgi:predicted ATPase/transcriptional regulator with XRE-family HTH domain